MSLGAVQGYHVPPKE